MLVAGLTSVLCGFRGGRLFSRSRTSRIRSDSPGRLLASAALCGTMPDMGFLLWIGDNWFTLLQSVGIIGGLLLTTSALNSDARTRRVANLIEITRGHRDIWSE